MARVLDWLRSAEDLELYFLVAAGLVFSALGLVGVVGQGVLGSAVLALLAVLAFSQLRTRRELTAIYRTQQLGRTSLFASRFPENLHARRAAAHDYLYVGRSMARTAVTSVGEFGRAIDRGATIRVVVADPTDDRLMDTIARGWRRDAPRDVRRRINATLRELASVRADGPGQLHVRVLGVVPHVSVNMIDADSDRGLLVVQQYEYRAAGEPGPIWTLTPEDGRWYDHFRSEAERIWRDATPVDLTVEPPVPKQSTRSETQ